MWYTDCMNEWQPIETAPKDGSRIWARAQNSAKRWMEPSIVWWAQNTAVDDPWIVAFWADRLSEQGNPINCYHTPLEWMPIPEGADVTNP